MIEAQYQSSVKFKIQNRLKQSGGSYIHSWALKQCLYTSLGRLSVNRCNVTMERTTKDSKLTCCEYV